MRDVIRILILVLCVVSAQRAPAAQGVSILENDRGVVTVELQKLAPVGEGLRAILAMYAIQVGSDCEGRAEELHCELTAALGVGPQCSTAHYALIRTWFRKSIPPMSGARPEAYRNVQAPGSLEEICYQAPDTASIQENWDRVRVRQEGDLVVIDALGHTLNRDTDTPFRFLSTYRVKDHSIVTVSHRRVPPRARKEGAR